jgi:peptidoglycan/LPS O-acetylase OafA/YrhL
MFHSRDAIVAFDRLGPAPEASHFRAEIAGLRAIAVIIVVLFHLKADALQGGFIGVDIFFVISGYLITRNILLDLQADRFSLGQFYVRRTRRIYPALIFTVVATYLCGALWSSPQMFLDLAKECTHALLSISNIQYWRESHEYFARHSQELALLHCWSLSLEEQFYLVWPLFLVLACRLGRPFQVIAIAALASLLFSIIVTRTDPQAVFFLMPFRVFEFACGALVLLLERRFRPSDAAANILSAAGLLCIAASALLFKSDMPYLGAATLLPCLGAAAIIWAGSKPQAARVLTNPAMVGVGAISYSLYLCHWPIIFFAHFIFGDAANSAAAILIMVVLMIAVATAMYLLIERRFIQPPGARPITFWKNAAAFGSVILALAAITHTTFLQKGFAWRLPEAAEELAHLQSYPTGRDLEPVAGPAGFSLVGDSYAVQYMAGLSPVMKPFNMRFDILAHSGCPILDGVIVRGPLGESCRSLRDRTLVKLEQTDLPIAWTQAWEFYSDKTIAFESDAEEPFPARLQRAIERTIERITARGQRLLIIGAQVIPGCPINRPRLLQGPLFHAPEPPCPPISRESVEQSTAPIDRMFARIQARWPGKFELLRPTDYFCDDTCPVVQDGIWLYSDQMHFSVAGSKYIVNRAADRFREFALSR